MSIVNPYRVVLNINVGGQGFSERYFTQLTAPGPSLVVATQIALYRTAFFAPSTKLVYAHCSLTDSSKDSISCDLPFPLGPHKSVPPGLDDPIEINDCVVERFETPDGRWMNRYVRGIPEDYIEGGVITTPLLFKPLPTGTAPYDPTGNANNQNICQSFWTYLLQNSPHTRKSGTNTYDQVLFARAFSRKVGSHKTGRPFGTSPGRRRANLIS